MQHVRSSTSGFWFSAVLTISLAVILATCPVTVAQTDDSAEGAAVSKSSFDSKKWQFSFGGVLMSGKVSTALLPVTEEYGDMNPIESPFGFGLGIDYNLSPTMRLFFDGNFYTYRKQVGAVGEYSSSFWVYEMTDYESHFIGPFEEDAFSVYADNRPQGRHQVWHPQEQFPPLGRSRVWFLCLESRLHDRRPHQNVGGR